jgi:hypothetical protein
MTIEERVLQKLRGLPPQRQQQVLDFVSGLQPSKLPRRSLLGLWSGLGVEISEDDIAKARRDLWGNFAQEVS